MKHYLSTLRKGFTLIELLVVIGILAVLLAITLIAINPARQFSQANNTKRSSDVNAILNAVDQFAADNKGALPTNMPAAGTVATIGNGALEADICADLVTRYLAALPVDPLVNNGTPISDCVVGGSTGYTIVRSATDNRVTVAAPSQELGAVISVTR
ncbi:hypothetical protein A2Z00_00920 [Candidatus Gottesmanbacteria bacterium RBG_13_45_10]|uniref:Type II secretion system protein GspG C-terminal domain-containing protein n=1 Tax=Candidatus Gottesmanbacteria bacterium RBG_13_45_10 TaxID=1798370 RepID=A0A1F5ZHP8_9BACT|nr:MAG: hypothetical protein A2Z00_00920 [Candidatus Gottesmanbacteria bacterium RBG_13_45_10]